MFDATNMRDRHEYTQPECSTAGHGSNMSRERRLQFVTGVRPAAPSRRATGGVRNGLRPRLRRP